jgi:competence protein ComEC
MKLAHVLAVAIVLLMLFGCGDQNPPTGDGTNGTNMTNKTNNTKPVTIIISNQTNQTKEQNKTETKNETPPEVKKELDYTIEPDLPLGVYFIDVGDVALHGDAILIKKGDFDMLIDAGPAEKGSVVVDFLKSKGVDDIEILVSTTGDPRRYGGIQAVADKFRIERFWWGGEQFDDSAYNALATRMGTITKGVDIVEDGFSGVFNGMNITALNPPTAKKFNDVNNDAIVLRVEDRNFTMLLTSDIQTGAQGRLVSERPALIKAQVMEAPYYGVGTGAANIAVFLNAARPKTMIITGSADESSANGGSRDPFRRLINSTQYSITWYESYKNGSLRLVYDGSAYDVGLANPPPPPPE